MMHFLFFPFKKKIVQFVNKRFEYDVALDRTYELVYPHVYNTIYHMMESAALYPH